MSNDLTNAILTDQTAQIAICTTIVAILIEKEIVSADEVISKFRGTADTMAKSQTGLVGAEIVGQIADFVEQKRPPSGSRPLSS